MDEEAKGQSPSERMQSLASGSFHPGTYVKQRVQGPSFKGSQAACLPPSASPPR